MKSRVAISLLAGLLALGLTPRAARNQEIVQFPSLADNGAAAAPTMLVGHLYRPAGSGARPAIIGLHGCSGLVGQRTGAVFPLYRDWASLLAAQGYVVLLVDSLTPRQHGESCSVTGAAPEIVRKRPKDAYAALLYLQSQSFVRADRIGAIGWSQGGGVVLNSIKADSLGRPATLPDGDFRVAVAFYPGACAERWQGSAWSSAIPLLVLIGDADVWTPLAPCKDFIDDAARRGASIDLQIYPGAYHAFDGPNTPVHERPEYRMRSGVVPIVGTDPAARADARTRVPAFLARFLLVD
jgi:dienelactone hydrolase